MSQFSELFADYARITDEIRAAARKSNGPDTLEIGIDPAEVVAELQSKYPDISLGPTELTAAVLAIAAEARVPIKGGGATTHG